MLKVPLPCQGDQCMKSCFISFLSYLKSYVLVVVITLLQGLGMAQMWPPMTRCDRFTFFPVSQSMFLYSCSNTISRCWCTVVIMQFYKPEPKGLLEGSTVIQMWQMTRCDRTASCYLTHRMLCNIKGGKDTKSAGVGSVSVDGLSRTFCMGREKVGLVIFMVYSNPTSNSDKPPLRSSLTHWVVKLSQGRRQCLIVSLYNTRW